MNDQQSMTGRICLVTGANQGIGKETALGLASMGATVVMTARDLSRGELAVADIKTRSGNDRIELIHGDFASFASIRELAADVRQRHPQLHVLVNNAGAYNARRTVTQDGYETTFGVNHLGYFLLTKLLLETMRMSGRARIVNVSSAAHTGATINFDDLQGDRHYRGFGAYGQSKLANVLFTYELARRLEGSSVTANCLHPGVVRTGFGKNNSGAVGGLFGVFHGIARPFLKTPESGARTSVYLASSPDVEGVTGRYFADCRQKASSALSHDRAIAGRLWEVSEAMVGAGTPSGAL